MQLSWPGNVRELRNLVHRLAALVEDETVRAEDVFTHKPRDGEDSASPPPPVNEPGLFDGISLRGTKKQNTMRLMQNQIRLLEVEGVSVDEICRTLDIGRTAFFRFKFGRDE